MTDEELEAEWKASHPIVCNEIPTDEEVRDPAFLAWYSAACDIEPTAANMIALRATMPEGLAFRCAMNGLENRVPFWAVSPGWVARKGARWLAENREFVRLFYFGRAPWTYVWPPEGDPSHGAPGPTRAEIEAFWKKRHSWEPTFT